MNPIARLRRRAAGMHAAQKLLLVVALLGGLLTLVPALPETFALDTTTLSVTTNTWDTIGLDSNKATTSPFDTFPVGAYVCNTGTLDATTVTATFAWKSGDTHDNLALKSGATTATSTVGTLAVGACTNVQFLVQVKKSSFQNTTKWKSADRDGVYSITATGTNVSGSPSTSDRTLYIQKIVSQNRNAVLGISSTACTATTCTFYKGQTYTVTLYAKSSPNGYDQSEAFLTFPESSFKLNSVKTYWSAPRGATADGVWGDGCGWVASGATSACGSGTYGYTGGKVGGNPIKVVYNVTALSSATSGTSTLQALIYDLSGGSFHYNADTGTAGAGSRTLVVADAADLQVSMSHTGAFTRGSTGAYAVSVTNNGPQSATSPSVSITLPAGLTASSITGTNWTCTTGTGVCTRASLASGVTAEPITVVATVAGNAGAALTASASVSSSTADPKTSNNTASDPTTTATAGDVDVVLTKTHPLARMPRTSTGTYTLAVRNDGPAVSGDLTVTDTLPVGLTYVSAASAGDEWACGASGQVVTCTRAGSLGVNTAAASITLTVTVDPSAADTVTNVATATSTGTNDPNPANNANVADPTDVASADLSLTKTHTGALPIGGSGAFTLTVANAGPDAASGPITVTDTLPAGMSLVSENSSTWACSAVGQAVTCTSTTPIPSGASSSFSMATSLAGTMAEGVVTNTASVSASTSDPDPSNNSAEDVAQVVKQQDLKVTVTASPTSVTSGTNDNTNGVTYTIVTQNLDTNSTGVNATGVFWTFDVPNGVLVDDGTASYPGPSGRTWALDCDAGSSTLGDPGASWPSQAVCFLNGGIPAGGSVTSVVKANYSTSFKTPSNPSVATVNAYMDQVDSNPANNASSASVAVTNGNAAPTASVSTTVGGSAVDEHATTTRQYSWSAYDADGIGSVSTSCGDDGTKVADGTASGAGTSVGSPRTATFTCVFDDGPATATISATVTDGNGGTTTSTATVAVANVAPVAAIGAPATVTAGAGYTVSASATDVSTADTTAGYTYAFDCGTGTFGPFGTASTATCTGPAAGDSTTVQVKAMDKDGGTSAAASATVTADAAASSAPVALDRTASTTVDTPVEVTLQAGDVDDQPQTFSVVTGPSNGTVGLAAGPDCSSSGGTRTCTIVATYTPTGGYTGTDTFTYRANDGTADSAEATVTIHVGTGNTAPTAAPVTTSTPPNTTKVITLSGTDADGDALTFAGVDTTALHGTLGTIGTPDCPDGTPRTCTATVDYTPATNYTGTASFTYEVNDGTDDSSAATVSIDVENAAPTATARSYPVQKNVALDLTTLQGSDADGDATTLSIVADPTHGTLGTLTTGTCTGTAPKTCAGSVTYTPDGDYTGTDTFTYQANDGLTDSTAVTVTLLVGNDVPIAADETATTDYETAVPVTLDGADVNGDATTFDVQPPGHGTLTGTGDTPTCATASGTRTCHLTVTYTPDTAFRGTDTFTYTVSDGTGSSVQHTVTLTVNSPANTAPTATARTYPVAKNTATALTTLQGSDADGDATTLSIVADPTHGTLGTLTTGTCTGTAPKTCAGSVTYTPDGDYTGTDTFTYAANDGTDGSVPVTVTLLVGNTAPTGADQSLTTAEDTPKAVTLAGTDADGDTPAITISVPPAHGTLGLLGTPACTGTAPRSCTVAVTYTPASNASGTDTFKYLVDDGTATNEYTITLTVTPANDAPTAADFAATTTRGTPVQVQLVGTDVDGDTTTAAVVTGPSGAAGTLGSLGAVACAGTDTRVCTVLATFTPAAGYTGSTSFTYRVHDGTAASANATVTIDVLDRAPTATPQSISTGTGNARTITLAVTDPDADTTALTIVTGPTHGTLVTVGAVQCTTTSGVSTCTATVTYTPADGYTGGDSFTFRGDDGVLHDDAAVAVTVSPTAGNHKPTVSITITPDAPRTDDDVTAHIVTANDADADGLTFDYVWSVNGVVLQRTYGTTALTDVYHLAPTGAGDLDGLVTATVRAHDGKELGPSDEATVQVQNSAPSPTASAVSVGVSDGTTASQRTFDLTGSDPDDQVLEFRVTSLPTQGQLWFGTHQITAGDLPYVLPDFGSRLTYETLATAERTDTFAFAAGDTRLWSTTTANVTVGTFEYGSVGGPVTTLAAGAGRTTYSAIVPGAITAADPVKTSVSATAPTSAGISIDISDAAPPSFTPPSGYALLGIQQTIDILQGGTRVDMTLNQPFMVGFQLGASLVGPDVPLAQVKIFRDGVEVADCPAAYPCVQSRVRDTTTGTVTITILSDHASGWSFGVPSSDTTPPETTIFSGPSGATSAGSPNNTAGGTLTFAYVASEAGSTFECQLTRNGGATGHEAWTACNSGGGGGTFTTSIAVGGLPDDLYTFRVRATDSSANLDATPARRDVVVDRTAPTVTIRTGPPATTTATSATVTFTANEVGVTFRCAIDLQAWNACNAGTWTASGLATGIHTIVVEGSDPASNHSTDARSFTVTVAGGGGGTGGGGRGTTTGIQRWAGTSRGTTAVDVSKQLFPNGADTVYVARDDLFPDALTGGPQAAFDKAPILLTSPSKLSSDTLQEIKRLDPQRIVIVGGTSAVDGSVERALRGLAPEVGRLPGTDRYETATLVSRAHYPGRVDTVVLATGLAFPDALSGGAAAAKIDGPVLLTRSDELPASTLAELKRLRPKRIIVLGGTEAVSAEVLQQVDAATSGTIVRIAGANRYATSAALSQLVFSPPIGAAFVATGEDFPDALAAVPAAATYGSPLLLTQNDQLVTETDTELRRLAPSDLVILGGTAAVAKAVEPALVRAMGT